jgi:hypothetical protein
MPCFDMDMGVPVGGRSRVEWKIDFTGFEKAI